MPVMLRALVLGDWLCVALKATFMPPYVVFYINADWFTVSKVPFPVLVCLSPLEAPITLSEAPRGYPVDSVLFV